MKTNKIGLFSFSPASINVMKSLIKEINNNDIEYELIVEGDFAEKVIIDELKRLEIDKELKNLKDLSKLDLDILIYNTGSGGDIELTIPLLCKELNIVSLCINDVYWDTDEGLKNRFKHEPDYLIVITNENKERVLKTTGLSDNQVEVIGNPYFDRLKDLNITEDRGYLSVSFISQCGLGGTYAEDTSDDCKKAFYELMELLKEGIITDLYIYKHPRETGQFYIDNGFNIEKTNEFLDMMRSGIIVSCGSTPHYEAIMVDKRTLFAGRDALRERVMDERWDSTKTKIDLESTEKVVNFIKYL